MTPHQMVCVVRWTCSTLGRVGGGADVSQSFVAQSFVAQCGKSGPFRSSVLHYQTYAGRAIVDQFSNVGGER